MTQLTLKYGTHEEIRKESEKLTERVVEIVRKNNGDVRPHQLMTLIHNALKEQDKRSRSRCSDKIKGSFAEMANTLSLNFCRDI